MASFNVWYPDDVTTSGQVKIVFHNLQHCFPPTAKIGLERNSSKTGVVNVNHDAEGFVASILDLRSGFHQVQVTLKKDVLILGLLILPLAIRSTLDP